MLTFHIAGTPEHGMQRCFRCNYILTDNRRVMVPIGQGLSWWQAGAFIGVTHDTFPVQLIAMDRDADPDDREEKSCQCPDADQDIAMGQLMPGQRGPFNKQTQ